MPSETEYQSLTDPSGLLPQDCRPVFPAEPALGGWYTELEVQAVVRAVRESMDWRIGFHAAEQVEAFEEAMCNLTNARFAVALNGAGTALDLVMRCLEIQPGDEVLSEALNFHGTHLAILGAGARLVLCEPNLDNFNIDLNYVQQCVNPRTRAIVVTSLHGSSMDIDKLDSIARETRCGRHGPPRVIVDASRALGATHNNRVIGKAGWATVFSFQSKKTLSTLGEGGVVTTDDPALALRLRKLRAFGWGQAWGSNFKMTKVQAAVGQVLLDRLPEVLKRRRSVAEERTRLLQDSTDTFTLPSTEEGYEHTYAFYPILLSKEWTRHRRDRLMAQLAIRGVGSVVANPPTYQYNHWIRERVRQRTSKAEALADRLFCPSFHPLMNTEDNTFIASAILQTIEDI